MQQPTTEPTSPTEPIAPEPVVEKKESPKPTFNLTFINDEKTLKQPMGTEKRTKNGIIGEVSVNVGKKQAKIKAELKRLEQLVNCIWG